MGAAPSREAHERQLNDLLQLTSSESFRNKILLLPLTKCLMNRLPAPSHSLSQSNGDGDGEPSLDGAYISALDLDAPPGELPLVKQLYDIYMEPRNRFFFRKEGVGEADQLPDHGYFDTLEAFYQSTVESYEHHLFDTDEEMQQQWEAQQLQDEGHSDDAKHESPGPAACPRRRGLLPVPCAICFQSPKPHRSAPADDGGVERKEVRFGPNCYACVVGFVGLVPLKTLESDRAHTQTGVFLKPPNLQAANTEQRTLMQDAIRTLQTGEGTNGAEEETTWELALFVSESAGKHLLCRSLFLAASMYVEQCCQAGIRGCPPVPSVLYTSFIMDVPYLSFLREMRMRCVKAGLQSDLFHSLQHVYVTKQMVVGLFPRRAAADFCNWLAGAMPTMVFHPTAHVPALYFAGFVQDGPEEAAALPTEGSDIIVSLLHEHASRTAKLEGECPTEFIRCYCVVGLFGLTHPSGKGARLPPGSLFLQHVSVTDGAFQMPEWELLPVERAAAHDITVLDVLLAWSKLEYLRARAASPSDPHWQRWDENTTVSGTSTHGPSLSLPSSSLLLPQEPGHTPYGKLVSADEPAPQSTLCFWGFEHRGRAFSIPVIPNFMRKTDTESASTNKEARRGKKGRRRAKGTISTVPGSTHSSSVGCSTSAPGSRLTSATSVPYDTRSVDGSWRSTTSSCSMYNCTVQSTIGILQLQPPSPRDSGEHLRRHCLQGNYGNNTPQTHSHGALSTSHPLIYTTGSESVSPGSLTRQSQSPRTAGEACKGDSFDASVSATLLHAGLEACHTVSTPTFSDVKETPLCPRPRKVTPWTTPSGVATRYKIYRGSQDAPPLQRRLSHNIGVHMSHINHDDHCCEPDRGCHCTSLDDAYGTAPPSLTDGSNDYSTFMSAYDMEQRAAHGYVRGCLHPVLSIAMQPPQRCNATALQGGAGDGAEYVETAKEFFMCEDGSVNYRWNWRS